MTKKIPQKRAAELVSLSHEHHHALVFCVRLKKTQQTPIETIQNYVNYFWENHISEHFENEEKYLIDLIANQSLKEQFLAEHKQIREVVNSILTYPEAANKNALILSEILNNHIRFEERVLFPEIENAAKKNELQAIAKHINKPIVCPVFYPEFWK